MTSSAAWTISFAMSAGKFAEILIHQGTRFFERSESADQLGRHGVAADIEVQQRTLCLCAPVNIGRDINFSHAVGFSAGLDLSLGGFDEGGHDDS